MVSCPSLGFLTGIVTSGQFRQSLTTKIGDSPRAAVDQESSRPSDAQRNRAIARVSGPVKLVGCTPFRRFPFSVDGDADRVAGFGLHIAEQHRVHHLAVHQGGSPAGSALERMFLPASSGRV